MTREKSFDENYADRMNSPLPGAMMPTGEEEKLVPEDAEEDAIPAKDAKQKFQYSDGGDQDQTIPV